MDPNGGPPIPDAFWLVIVGANGCGCGAMTVLMLLAMLSGWIALSRGVMERKLARQRAYMRKIRDE